RPSETRLMEVAIKENGSPPRQSSIWSRNSSEGRRASIVTAAKQMFRKGSTSSVEEEPRNAGET
ncbi:hypothetical protein MMC08_009074, partial [Hypocenomyce scalaris]|nr:hypothetical protein [Hypocenomyce scalaris]